MRYLLTFAIYIATALAAVVTTYYDIGYDALTAPIYVPGQPGTAIPTPKFHGLVYTGTAQVYKPSTALALILPPPSSPNILIATSTTGATALRLSPSADKAKITFTEFKFACLYNAVGLAPVTVPCNLTYAGVDALGTSTIRKAEYTGGSAFATADMKLSLASRISFRVTAATLAGLPLASGEPIELLLDNFRYSVSTTK